MTRLFLRIDFATGGHATGATKNNLVDLEGPRGVQGGHIRVVKMGIPVLRAIGAKNVSIQRQFSRHISLLVVATAAFAISGILAAQGPQETFKRLQPSAFPNLPATFRKRLEARGCTVPQQNYEGNQKLSNVIHGEFSKKGQQDWAVLCSKDGNSSIVLSWGQPTSCPSELASQSDLVYELLDGTYIREIAPITRNDIIGISVVGGGDGVHVPPNYPVLDHAGIDDAFLGKASEIHFCSEGKWITLQGAE
jgi:hypothetical protein